MIQLNLPRKKVALAQVLVSLLLILMTLIFSFTSILSIDISDSVLRENVQTSLDSLSKEVDGFDSVKIPEKIDVTMPRLFKADMIMAKLITVAINSTKEDDTLTKQDRDKIEKAKADLQEMITDEEGQEALITVIVAMGQIVDLSGAEEEKDEPISDTLDGIIDDELLDEEAEESSEAEEEKKSSTADAILLIIRIISMFYILIFITIFPIIVGIAALVNLIRVLAHRNDPENVVAKVSGATISYLPVVLLFALAMTLFNGMELGYGLIAILVFALLNVVINIVATRLRSYESSDLRFVNITQGTALVATVGALLFLFNLLKTTVLVDFLNSFGSYIEKRDNQIKEINAEIRLFNLFADDKIGEFNPSASFYVDLILAVLFFIIAISIACSVVKVCASRLGLAKAKKSNDGFISLGVGSIICSVLPFVLGILKSAKDYSFEIKNDKFIVSEEVEGAIYNLSSDDKTAVTFMLIGGILILVAGIAAKVLKSKFCTDLTEEREALIMNGKAPVPVVTATATATATETPAATEAPAAVTATAESEEPAPATDAPVESGETTASKTENTEEN